MKNTHKVLIIGGSHHNTYSLLRCFGEAGLNVDLILYGCKESYIGHSIYIDHFWYCPNVEEALKKARALVSEKQAFYVVISATDAMASLMDLKYDEFNGNCHFFNAGEAGLLTHYMDKEIQTAEAARVGFAVPKTISFNKGDSLRSDVFPCLIKPLASIDGGKRIAVCHNQDEINACTGRFADVEKVLVQQFIEKEEEIVILGVAVGGEVAIPGFIIKYRDINGGTTYSSTAPIDNLDREVVDSAKRLVKNMNYEGLFGIECIKSGDKYYFIEINLRNDATSYSLAVAGVNLPLMYYQYWDEEQPLVYEGKIRKLYSMVDIKDFRNVLYRKVGLFTWLRQKNRCECLYHYSQEDKEAYKLAKREFVQQLTDRMFRKNESAVK